MTSSSFVGSVLFFPDPSAAAEPKSSLASVQIVLAVSHETHGRGGDVCKKKLKLGELCQVAQGLRADVNQELLYYFSTAELRSVSSTVV